LDRPTPCPIGNPDRLSVERCCGGHRLAFDCRHGVQFDQHLAGNRGRALAKAEAAWREAAYVVSLRWDAFLRSEALTRSFAFGSYLAALDAEEAAAAEVSRLVAGTAGSAAAA
jgi:hypothetical protein